MPTEQYTHGEVVTITATPDDCCEFLYWVEDTRPCIPVSYNSVLTFTADRDVNYIPIFRKKLVNVNITANLPTFCCIYGNGKYDCGSNITVTITTALCNTLTWANGALNSDNEVIINSLYSIEHTFTVTEDINEEIIVTLGHSTIDVVSCGNGGVVILTGGNTVNHNASEYICGETEPENTNPCDYIGVTTHGTEYTGICGSEVTILATPASGNVFLGWIESADCVDCAQQSTYISTERAYPLILSGNDRRFIACFAEN